MVVNPYLNFNGNTEEVFNFYKSIFGGEFAFLQRFKDIPKDESNTEGCVEEVPEAEGNKIMHISLNIGSTMLMGTDVPSTMEQVKSGTNLSLCISTDSKADADRIFKGLSEGGKVQMPLQDMFWGDYYGMLTDKFQVQWMISFNPTNDGKNDKS